MQRIPEPELMEDPEQALAYARADFSVAHGTRVSLFRSLFPQLDLTGAVLDLGCGPGDILLRFARAYAGAHFFGIDGSMPALELAHQAINEQPLLKSRLNVAYGLIPQGPFPSRSWQMIMSHSVLHQLHRPEVLWQTIRQHGSAGCVVFVADLRRPHTEVEARRVVSVVSKQEPEVLQRDFFNSLCAAFEPDEVRQQLVDAGLSHLEVRLHDPFFLTVHGLL